jgi:hypothetical protein
MASIQHQAAIAARRRNTMPSKEVILVKQIEMAQAPVHLIGTTPLMVHKFSEKSKRQILEKQQMKVGKPKEIRNPWEDSIEGAYWLEGKPTEYTEAAFNEAVANGAKLGFPATGVKDSAVSGAYRNKLSKDKISLYGAFHVIGGELIEVVGKPEVREDCVKVGMGTTDLRYRVWFPKWEVRFEIIYNLAMITLEQILSYFEAGGFAVGIGEYRVEKGGIFGSYKVAADGEAA